MTVALGMTCSDGVLVATDSMGSSGKIATEVKKAHALERFPIVWAMTGSNFMNQQVTQAVSQAERHRKAAPTSRKIADKLRPVITKAWQTPVTPPAGDPTDRGAHACEALILGWENDRPVMIHLPADLAPIEYGDQAFIAIGSGHEFAAVARETLAHHLGDPLTTRQALLIAHRVVSVVCRTSSWGVAPPVQIAMADAAGARVLTTGDLETLETGVERWLATDADNFAGRVQPAAEELPTIGTATSESA